MREWQTYLQVPANLPKKQENKMFSKKKLLPSLYLQKILSPYLNIFFKKMKNRQTNFREKLQKIYLSNQLKGQMERWGVWQWELHRRDCMMVKWSVTTLVMYFDDAWCYFCQFINNCIGNILLDDKFFQRVLCSLCCFR